VAGYYSATRPHAAAAPLADFCTAAYINDIDPLAWLADVLARIAAIPQSRLPELLPWEWKTSRQQQAA
jgi:transposase